MTTTTTNRRETGRKGATMATILTTTDSLWDSLSNLELATVLDGGSAQVVVQLPGETDWVSAYVDADGLCLAGEEEYPSRFGYVHDLQGVKIDRHY